jgi:pseudaminic acid biosynthesis-associated methylase
MDCERRMQYKTEQETFWAGEFGTDYVDRNTGPEPLAANLALFSRALANTRGLSSCIEFGANIGLNLRALRLLFPKQEQYAIEINPAAVTQLGAAIPPENIYPTSILDFTPNRTWDLAMTMGVLIHIDPDWLHRVYDKLYSAADRYILICEYYNPSPVQMHYRGHSNRLYKRDFAGEVLDRFQDLSLVDYGFVYHRDPNFPQDDVTWFLLEK